MPSAEVEEPGTWDVGVYGLHSPLVAWERTLVAGPFLPNPDDPEYENTVPDPETGRYPSTPNRDDPNQANVTTIRDFYRMRYRQPQPLSMHGLPHNDGPSYYAFHPRMTTVAPYFWWTPNASLSIGMQWYTIGSTKIGDYHTATREPETRPVLDFPVLRAKWQFLAHGKYAPDMAMGFDMLTNTRTGERFHRDYAGYERFAYLVMTRRFGAVAVSVGGVNLNFQSIGGAFGGVSARLDRNLSLAADWNWATWNDPGAPFSYLTHHAQNFMTVSLAAQVRAAGWLLEAGWAGGLGKRTAAANRFPMIRVAREIQWKHLWSLLYYDPDPA